MAIPIYRVSILGRAAGGPSVVGASAYGSGQVVRVSSMLAAASYRSGEAQRDHQLGQTFDYSSRDDVKHAEILTQQHAPEWAKHRETLWNEVERKENRRNSQLARGIIMALPRDLPLEKQIALMREHLQEQFVSKGMVADFAIHETTASDGLPQPHAHVLLTMRGFNADGTWQKNKNREWNGYDANGRQTGDLIEGWRAAWEKTQNAFLEREGSDERVSMKSYQEQGIDKIPQQHMGPKSTAREERGEATIEGNFNRWVAQRNKIIEAVKGWAKRLFTREQTEPVQEEAKPREYTADDIKDYYAKMEAAQDRIYEPSIEDMKKEERRRQGERQAKEKAKAASGKETRRNPWQDAKPQADNRPHRTASPEDREHYKALRPFLQNHTWGSRQDMLHFIAVTSKHMHQKKAEARRDPFERLAGARDTQRFRAVWQDRPIPKPGQERSRGGRER